MKDRLRETGLYFLLWCVVCVLLCRLCIMCVCVCVCVARGGQRAERGTAVASVAEPAFEAQTHSVDSFSRAAREGRG